MGSAGGWDRCDHDNALAEEYRSSCQQQAGRRPDHVTLKAPGYVDQALHCGPPIDGLRRGDTLLKSGQLQPRRTAETVVVFPDIDREGVCNVFRGGPSNRLPEKREIENVIVVMAVPHFFLPRFDNSDRDFQVFSTCGRQRRASKGLRKGDEPLVSTMARVRAR